MIQNWVQQTRRHKVVFVQAFVVTLSLLVLCISFGTAVYYICSKNKRNENRTSLLKGGSFLSLTDQQESKRLTFRELFVLTGLTETVFLTLDHTAINRDKSFSAKKRLVGVISFD